MYNYSYTTTKLDSSEALGDVFAAVGVGTWIFSIVVMVVAIIAMWKVFTKAGEEGWKSIIPIYNTIVLFKIAGLNPLMVLLYLVPVANIVVTILLYINLAKAFGKGGGFAAGLIFLNTIFMLILGFGDSQYVGPQA